MDAPACRANEGPSDRANPNADNNRAAISAVTSPTTISRDVPAISAATIASSESGTSSAKFA